MAAPAAAPVLPRTVDIEGVGRAMARLYGIVDTTSLQASSADAGDTEVRQVEAYITQMPYYIGRHRDFTAGGEDGPMNVHNSLLVASAKVSREHAFIDKTKDGFFFIKCLSKNGIDINGKHVKQGETEALASMARVRVGPLYVYFLLPKASGGTVTRTRSTVPYRVMLEGIYQKHFAGEGFFCLTDLVANAYADYPDANIPELEENTRRNFALAVKKDGAYVSVPASEVPLHLTAEVPGRTRRHVGWFKFVGRSAAATAAAQAAEGDEEDGEDGAQDGEEDADGDTEMPEAVM